MKNKVLTLKQLADKLDVSKSYIDKIIRTLGMHTELEKKGNKYVVNVIQQREIERFLDDKKTHTETHTKLNTSMHTGESSEVVFLRSQLVERNKEIENLYKILDQQQQLTLQSNKQIEQLQLQLDTRDNVQSVQDDPDSSKVTESIEQSDLLEQLKNELETSKSENEHLKNTISSLNEAPKKGFWKRLFDA